jgi:hypothetical protein
MLQDDERDDLAAEWADRQWVTASGDGEGP